MATPVIGIDLGTTNTVVAVVRDGQASAIPDENGNVLLPSVVSFHPSGSILVGRAAKERRLVDSLNTIYSVKRLIGRSWDSEEVRKARSRFPFQMKEGPGQAALVVARGETYTLPEISAFVLRKAKTIAEAALGTSVERAVITVPANFNDLQRAATKVAGRVAGLEVVRILNEPTAAALAYGYGRSSAERIAVYDFGGGTFDVTLLDLSDNVFEVLATAGNTFLGGDDLDLAIAERMAEAFLARHRYDPRAEPQIYEHLKVAAEEVKHRLSTEPQVTVDIKDIAHGPGGQPLDLSFTLARAELEELAAPLIERTFDVCNEALRVARLSVDDFQQLLLVGGSTRVPLVKRRVEDFWRREVRSNISPDEVVAIGAAIQASALSGAEARRKGTVPPAPSPARQRMPSANDLDGPSALSRRRSATLPGEAPVPNTAPGPALQSANAPRPRMDTAPDAFGIPSTQPFFGRERTVTRPGVHDGADPAAPSRAPVLGVLGKPTEGLERAKQKTGIGLGPAARGSSGATLVSASDAALAATADVALDLPLVTPDSPAPSGGSPTKEESVAFQLGDGDIEELTTAPPPARKGMRPLAQPMSFGPPAGDDPAPELPDDEPTKVGAPSARALERARREGLALLHEQEEAARRTAPLAAAPRSPLPASTAGTEEPPRFGALNLGMPLAGPFGPPPARAGATTAPLAAVGSEAAARRSPEPSPPATLPLHPLLVDVTPLTLAVETVEGFCDAIIARNTTVPCSRTREFVTAADNQTAVRIRVSQGESTRFHDNTLLGEVELSGLRAARRGDVRIAVSFALDVSGMLVVSAKDVGTGRETSAQVRLVGLPDATEVARMQERQAARGM
jgi:molecular chaperone DnaK